MNNSAAASWLRSREANAVRKSTAFAGSVVTLDRSSRGRVKPPPPSAGATPLTCLPPVESRSWGSARILRVAFGILPNASVAGDALQRFPPCRPTDVLRKMRRTARKMRALPHERDSTGDAAFAHIVPAPEGLHKVAAAFWLRSREANAVCKSTAFACVLVVSLTLASLQLHLNAAELLATLTCTTAAFKAVLTHTALQNASRTAVTLGGSS